MRRPSNHSQQPKEAKMKKHIDHDQLPCFRADIETT